jgi:hypothetical protein
VVLEPLLSAEDEFVLQGARVLDDEADGLSWRTSIVDGVKRTLSLTSSATVRETLDASPATPIASLS